MNVLQIYSKGSLFPTKSIHFNQMQMWPKLRQVVASNDITHHRWVGKLNTYENFIGVEYNCVLWVFITFCFYIFVFASKWNFFCFLCFWELFSMVIFESFRYHLIFWCFLRSLKYNNSNDLLKSVPVFVEKYSCMSTIEVSSKAQSEQRSMFEKSYYV